MGLILSRLIHHSIRFFASLFFPLPVRYPRLLLEAAERARMLRPNQNDSSDDEQPMLDQNPVAEGTPASICTTSALLAQNVNDFKMRLALPTAQCLENKNIIQQLNCRAVNPSMAKTFEFDYCERFLPNRRRNITSLATKTFCAQYVNGDDIVTGSQDGYFRYYSRAKANGQHYRSMSCLAAPVVAWTILDMDFCPTAPLMVYSTWSTSIYVNNTSTFFEGKRNTVEQIDSLRRFPLGSEFTSPLAVFQVKWSHDGREILVGTSAQAIFCFDVEAGAVTAKVSGHADDVNAVCYGTGNHYILSGGDDGLCKVWDRRTFCESIGPCGTFAGHRDGLTSVDMCGDDRFVMTNSKDQTIKIWDVRKFASSEGIASTFRSVHSQRWDYRINPNPPLNSSLLCGDVSLMTLFGHTVRHTLIRAKFSPSSTGWRYAYTGCAGGRAFIYDLQTGNIVRVLTGHRSVVRSCDWNNDSNELVTSSWDGQTKVWNYDKNKNSEFITHDTIVSDDESDTASTRWAIPK